MINTIPFIYVGQCGAVHVFSYTHIEDIDHGYDQIEVKVHKDNIDAVPEEGFAYYLEEFKRYDIYIVNQAQGLEFHMSGTSFRKE